MQNDNARNTIIFVVSTVAILILYQIFVLQPTAERRKAAMEAQAPQAAASAAGASAAPTIAPVRGFVSREAAAAASERAQVRTPLLSGSVSLTGARIDDLFLTGYRETTERASPAVELFRPEGAEHAYFAQFGWVGQNVAGLPGPNTPWRLAGGRTLTPATPLVLEHVSPEGLTFTRTISVDDQYMFTVTDRVANTSARPITIAPYGSVQRRGVPDDLGKNMILHEGAVGVLGGKLKEIKYKKWREDERAFQRESTGGWAGITDKYWLAAIVPDQSRPFEGGFRVTPAGDQLVHEAVYVGRARTLAPGAVITETNRLYAGAKREEILSGYQTALGVPRLDAAIDWGNFWFLTRPIFVVLEFFYNLVGNFGVAILLLTVAVKLVLFPMANKSYESMSKMKKLQPKVEEIKKRFGSDPQKQQQEMLALYQKEKINPLAGCLPIFVQIPVFYALYKVLFVTIEMRHAPFFGWIVDLSSRDPTTIWNLFGLIPWDPATAPLLGSILNGPAHIGVWPLIMGFTMWLQQAMNPPAPDPVQRQIFALFPFLFTFMLAPFAAGLVIYWTWNNLLSILQQYVIMRRLGVENPIDGAIARVRALRAPAQ